VTEAEDFKVAIDGFWLVTSVEGKPVTLRIFAIMILTVSSVCAAKQRSDSTDPFPAFTQAQLLAAIEKTHHESTRMEGIKELVHFAGMRLYEGSVMFGDASPQLTRLRGQAAAVVWSCADVATVTRALDDGDRYVRFWGLWKSDLLKNAPTGPDLLLPKLKTMLHDPDPGIRQAVVGRIRPYPEGPQMIAEIEPTETDPYVLIAMDGYHAALVRSLSSRDVNIRNRTLALIWVNLWNSAVPNMNKLPYDAEVHQLVLAIAATPESAEEKELALRTLAQLDALKLQQLQSPSN
jgi:hypothetical protein